MIGEATAALVALGMKSRKAVRLVSAALESGSYTDSAALIAAATRKPK